MIYQPEDDSYLLERVVLEKVCSGMRVLDMGTGSGILALAAQAKGAIVSAVDIDAQVILQFPDTAITVIHSDLFAKVSERFDCIIFNPPYLPDEAKDPDIALDGGKEGWELIARFLTEAKHHLMKEGFILLLFSTKSNVDKVLEAISSNDYEAEELAQKSLFFEKLFVYELRRKKKEE